MLTDYWAHKFYTDPKLKEEVEDDDFNLDDVVRQMAEDDWETVVSMNVTQ